MAEDARSAHVLVSVAGDDEECQRTLEGLEAAKNFVRRETGRPSAAAPRTGTSFSDRPFGAVGESRGRASNTRKETEQEVVSYQLSATVVGRQWLVVRKSGRLIANDDDQRLTNNDVTSMLDRVLQAIRERHRFVVTSHARPTATASVRLWPAAKFCGRWARTPKSSCMTAFPYLSRPALCRPRYSRRHGSGERCCHSAGVRQHAAGNAQGARPVFSHQYRSSPQRAQFCECELDRFFRHGNGRACLSPGAYGVCPYRSRYCNLPLHRAHDRYRFVHVRGNR